MSGNFESSFFGKNHSGHGSELLYDLLDIPKRFEGFTLRQKKNFFVAVLMLLPYINEKAAANSCATALLQRFLLYRSAIINNLLILKD